MGMKARSDTLCEQETPAVSTEKIMSQEYLATPTSADRSLIASTSKSVSEVVTHNDDYNDSDEDEFHDCLSWDEGDFEVGVDAGATSSATADKPKCICSQSECCRLKLFSGTDSLPKPLKDSSNLKTKWLNQQMPPHKVAPDGTIVHYWCDIPTKRASFDGHSRGMFFYLCLYYTCLKVEHKIQLFKKSTYKIRGVVFSFKKVFSIFLIEFISDSRLEYVF